MLRWKVLPVYRIHRDESCNILFHKDQQCNSKRRLKRLYFGLERLILGFDFVLARKWKRLGVMWLLVFSLVCVFVATKARRHKVFFYADFKKI